MSYPPNRERARRFSHTSERPAIPMLSAYGGSSNSNNNSMATPSPLPPALGECMPVYFHVDTLPPAQVQPQSHVQPRSQSHYFHQPRQQQPSFHNNRTHEQQQQQQHRSASYHSQPPSHRQHPRQFSSPPRFFPPQPSMSQRSPSHLLQPPRIIDAYTLTRAVQIDPEATFQQLQYVFQERNELQIRVTVLQNDLDAMRKDYGALMRGHERMAEIWLEKQFLMWRFVERVKLEGSAEMIGKEHDGVGGGEWMGEHDAEEGMTKEDVDVLWTKHFRTRREDEDETDVGLDDLVSVDEGERGRSRYVKALREESLGFASAGEAEMSVGFSTVESVNNEMTESFDGRLDPSAKPFQPSPTRRSQQDEGRLTQSLGLDDTTIRTVPILSFRDVLTGSSAVSHPFVAQPARSKSVDSAAKSPEKPWVQVKHRKSEYHEHLKPNPIDSKRPLSKSRSIISSRGSSSVRGGKKSNSRRGGQSLSNPPSVKPSDKKEHTQHPIKSPERSRLKEVKPQQNKHHHKPHSGHGHPPSPRKLNDPWRSTNTITQASSTISSPSPNRHHPRLRPRKKHPSPEVERIANLPFYPVSNSDQFMSSKTRRSPSPQISPSSKKRERYDGEMGPPLFARSMMPDPTPAMISQKTFPFMSRARLQATLQSIAAPYATVCPNSLLGITCDVVDCSLLKLCPHFNFTPNAHSYASEEEEEFPALGSETSQSSSRGKGAQSSSCKKMDGTHVKDGEICSEAYIHLKSSCMAEVNSLPCQFWDSPPHHYSTNAYDTTRANFTTVATSTGMTTTTTSKKFRSISLDYDYTAPPADLRRLLPSSSLSSSSTTTTASKDPSITDLTSQLRKSRVEQNNRMTTREIHFTTTIHERDGIGRDAWHARCLNAKLKGVHESGLWGIQIPPSILNPSTSSVSESRNSEVDHEHLSRLNLAQGELHEENAASDFSTATEELTKTMNENQVQGPAKTSDYWGKARSWTKQYIPARDEDCK